MRKANTILRGVPMSKCPVICEYTHVCMPFSSITRNTPIRTHTDASVVLTCKFHVLGLHTYLCLFFLQKPSHSRDSGLPRYYMIIIEIRIIKCIEQIPLDADNMSIIFGNSGKTYMYFQQLMQARRRLRWKKNGFQ